MKIKSLVYGMAALLAFTLLLPGCSSDDDGGTSPARNLVGGAIKSSDIQDDDIRAALGGGGVSFSVTQATSTVSSISRAAVGATLTPISGKIQFGNVIINLEGYHDEDSENFTFSGAAGSFAFEFFGIITEGKAAGKLKMKNAAGGWTEEVVSFDFDNNFLINGNAQASAVSLPEEWLGKWSPFTEDLWAGNAQLTEQFGVMDGTEMVLSPHSITFFFDVQERVDYVEGIVQNAIDGDYIDDFGGEAFFRQEAMYMQVYNRLAGFSIYEITDNGNDTYDVLAAKSETLPDEYAPEGVFRFKTKTNYMKLRFQAGTGTYTDELWITFCNFEDGGWDTFTDDIAKARAGNTFSDDRAEWASGANLTMLVAKR